MRMHAYTFLSQIFDYGNTAIEKRAIQAPEQPAPAQVLFCNHHPVLRC